MNSSSHDSIQEENNDTLVHTSTGEKNTSQSSSDQLLRLMLHKMDAFENFMIRMDIKLDNVCQNFNTRRNERFSDGNQSTEIDISELKKLGIPAESESDMKKLEENLKIEDFRKKLVRELYFNFFTI